MLTRPALFSVTVWLAFAGVLRVAVIPPESCGRDDPPSIQQAASAAIGWLSLNQGPDGRYVYLYYGDTDTVPDEYNDVRHAGVTVALYQAAGRYGDPAAFRAAEVGLGWMTDRLVRRHDWAALAPYEDSASLGATALMTVALAERRLATSDTTYDPLLHDLGRFITAAQRPDGGFYVYWDLQTDEPDRQSTSRYYPGESLWALALLHQAFPGEGWDTAARRALDFITTLRDDVEDVSFPPLADQWAAYGMAEMSGWGLSDAQIAYARRLAERFGFLVRIEAQRQHPSAEGLGTLVRGHETRAAGMGTWVEALAALWRVSATDPRLADLAPKLLQRAKCAAGILAERQVSAAEAARHPRPDLMRGAWFQGGETRMDDQQHAFSGLLYTLDALHGRAQRGPAGPVPGLLP